MTEYSTLYDQLKYRGVNGKIHDVFEAIRNYSGPVLIIHGDKDKVVDISYGRRATEVYKHAEFVCLPGESHGFIGAGRKKAAQLSYEFL